MKTSQDGLDLIKSFEGLSLKAYVCPANKITIGYGHTGSDVKPGMVINEQQANELLRKDVEKFERGIDELVSVSLTQGQFDALVAFTFNVGLGAFEKSTMLKKINSGDYEGAASEFGRWTKAAGRVLNGLVTRREAERRLFIS